MIVMKFGGSSVATASFVRRNMNGRTRALNIAWRAASPCFSIGWR